MNNPAVNIDSIIDIAIHFPRFSTKKSRPGPGIPWRRMASAII